MSVFSCSRLPQTQHFIMGWLTGLFQILLIFQLLLNGCLFLSPRNRSCLVNFSEDWLAFRVLQLYWPVCLQTMEWGQTERCWRGGTGITFCPVASIFLWVSRHTADCETFSKCWWATAQVTVNKFRSFHLCLWRKTVSGHRLRESESVLVLRRRTEVFLLPSFRILYLSLFWS